jgi:DNA-binding response OmpR family regulator
MGQDLILVVDDDRDLQDMLEFVLQLGNCRVARAGSGRVGLELLSGARPCMVLLDLMLPDMRGEEFYARLCALPGAAPPVVLMSAAVDVGDRAGRLGLPYLAKPFEVEELMSIVQQSCPSATPV